MGASITNPGSTTASGAVDLCAGPRLFQTKVAIISQDSCTFKARFRQIMAIDKRFLGGTDQQLSEPSIHIVDFGINANPGESWKATITHRRKAEVVIHHDGGKCAWGLMGPITVAVAGPGTLDQSLNTGLNIGACNCKNTDNCDGCTDCFETENQRGDATHTADETKTAILSGIGPGSVTLTFTWHSTVQAIASAVSGSDEAVIKLGMSAGENSSWLNNCDDIIDAAYYYPAADEGHIVEVRLVTSDSCNSCTPIGIGTINGSTTCATPDGASACDPGAFKDVWYCYTAPCDGIVDIDTCGSSFDTVLSVHTGCPGNTGNEIIIGPGCDDCGGGIVPCGFLDSCGSFQANKDQTYWIRVTGSAGLSGEFALTLDFRLAAADEPSSPAIPIIIGSGPTYGTTLNATPSAPGFLIPAPCGQSANVNDVWYSVTPACTGAITVETCNCPCPPSLWYDTVLSVYTGPTSGGSMIQVANACNDDNCPVPAGPPPAGCDPPGTAPPWLSRLTFPGIGGVTYYIRVSGYEWTNPTGDFRLDVTQALVTPSNDLCANSISVSNGTYAFDTCGATNSPAPAGCTVNQDIWYRWVAPSTCSGTVTVDTCGSLFDTSLAVYSGSCTGPQVACNNNAGSGCPSTPQSSVVSFNATPGAVYFIRVGSPGAGAGSGQLTISGPHPNVGTCPPSSNAPTQRLFQFVGQVTGTPGAWCMRAPCCFQRQDLNVAGAIPGNMPDLVNKFVNSVNGCVVNGVNTLVAKA
ncbi:MAG: hypothetical protein O7E57_16785, partial [Gammaproteobacteria bacterium]|nr:hypothetical protein [Gammaproteobacteria bacterium]